MSDWELVEDAVGLVWYERWATPQPVGPFIVTKDEWDDTVDPPRRTILETMPEMAPLPPLVCQCPEAERPGWFHRAPIDCVPLLDGESIQEWRQRRYH